MSALREPAVTYYHGSETVILGASKRWSGQAGSKGHTDLA